jgi:hypothetical protein
MFLNGDLKDIHQKCIADTQQAAMQEMLADRK